MNGFPSDIRFRRSWRSYQQRVLSELEDHLDDDHLHIIAAPGSGKTVLGLEVMRRLDRPALILAPTVAIRDQWMDRLIELFMEPGSKAPKWMSKDLRRPQFLTASTYQGLYSIYKDEAEDEPGGGSTVGDKDALLKRLRKIGVRTLVLDEAHHLRSEWWRCLIDLKKHVEGPTVVSLTATPPFDVTPLEWERYVELCGPIDAEISVPELVAQRNLCPHQDYVRMSAPLQGEREQIAEFRRQTHEFIQALYANPEFLEALEQHACVARPDECAEEVLADPAFYASVAAYLNHVRGVPPRKLLRLIGLSPRKCPKLDMELLEALLAGCFYRHAKSFADHKAMLQRILREAKRIGIVDKREVNLRSSPRIAKLLIRSVSKLESIEQIVRLESEALGTDLRMVILTDYIRRADFPKDASDLQPIRRLGVVPIFEHVRRRLGADDATTAGSGDCPFGILSGSLAVVPRASGKLLRGIAPEVGLDPADLHLRPLGHDERFCELSLRGADKQKMVRLITRLFNRGGVRVLIGTTSLLGEGWDAPSVNSLILASFVGSYMLSNQMRGRAIRTQEGNPSKTANIWHLVCQEQSAPQLDEDMETLARRFKSFAGVSMTSDRIESGLGRLGLGQPPYTAARMEHINAEMAARARDRARLAVDWERALASAREGRLVEQVAASQLLLPRELVFRGTILALVWEGWFSAVAAFSLVAQSVEANAERMTFRGFLLFLGIASALAALAALPKCLKALWLFLRHGSIASSMRQVGKAVLKAMVHADQIETNPLQLRVTARRLDYGFVRCSLQGGTTRERSVFLEALEEVLGPVENPRYVLLRRSPFGWFMRRDYHPVPKALGRNKDTAEFFRKMWTRHVGPTRLVYTRTPKGRRFLLKARAGSMARSFQSRAERLKSWQ